MTWIKRAVLLCLILAALIVYFYFNFPAIYEGDNYHVEGVCVEAYSGRFARRRRIRYIVMDDGTHYQLIGDQMREGYKELEGKELSFFASKFGFNPSAFAFDQGSDAANAENIAEIRKDEIRDMIISVAIIGSFAAIVIFIKPVFELWEKRSNEVDLKDMLKRRKLKRAKRQMQAEKYKNLEDATEERHIQNKNMSRKKQKQRKKQNKGKGKNK